MVWWFGCDRTVQGPIFGLTVRFDGIAGLTNPAGSPTRAAFQLDVRTTRPRGVSDMLRNAASHEELVLDAAPFGSQDGSIFGGR